MRVRVLDRGPGASISLPGPGPDGRAGDVIDMDDALAERLIAADLVAAVTRAKAAPPPDPVPPPKPPRVSDLAEHLVGKPRDYVEAMRDADSRATAAELYDDALEALD